MNFFRVFARRRRNSLRNLVRLRVRRERLSLLINAETVRLLRDQPHLRQEILRELQPVPLGKPLVQSGPQAQDHHAANHPWAWGP